MELRGWIGGSNTAQSPWADAEMTMNFYYEEVQSVGGSTRAALYPTPGVDLLSTATAGPGSAHFFLAGREFAIIGTKFIEIDQYGVQTERGTVTVDSNPATISSNGDAGGQLFITSGGNGYLFTLATNTFASIAALAGIATMGDQLDGYFLCLDAGTSTLFISDLLDGATWDPTQYAQRTIAADPWVSMKVANRYIYLFGTETSEAWYDAGSFPFPFAPHPSGLFQYGCAAAFSPEVVKGTVIWLASTVNGTADVMRVSGFNPESVATYATHVAFEEYGDLADAVGDTYEDLGHTFYVITFRSDSATWVYDSDTNLWHQRGFWNTVSSEFEAWRLLYHAFAFGQHRWLDVSGAGLYHASSEFYTDVDDEAIRRVRRGPAIFQENKRIFISSFELDLEAGLGTGSGQGEDPQVMMRMSNDGGKTWSPEQQASAGEQGQYGVRVHWNRCGMARRRVFEVSVTDPIPWRILNAYVEILPSQEIIDSRRQAAA